MRSVSNSLRIQVLFALSSIRWSLFLLLGLLPLLTSLITKIHKLAFAIVYLTTIALPAWHAACVAHGQPACILPCDVKTRWNLTYDMLIVAFKYCTVIDNVTGNKSLKLCQYELDDGEWATIKDLLQVLKVSMLPYHFVCVNSILSADV
jgi:hypothetical protein